MNPKDRKKLDKNSIKKYSSASNNNIKKCDIESLKKSYVGSQGWKEFHRDLIKAIKKEYKNFEE